MLSLLPSMGMCFQPAERRFYRFNRQTWVSTSLLQMNFYYLKGSLFYDFHTISNFSWNKMSVTAYVDLILLSPPVHYLFSITTSWSHLMSKKISTIIPSTDAEGALNHLAGPLLKHPVGAHFIVVPYRVYKRPSLPPREEVAVMLTGGSLHLVAAQRAYKRHAGRERLPAPRPDTSLNGRVPGLS